MELIKQTAVKKKKKFIIIIILWQSYSTLSGFYSNEEFESTDINGIKIYIR